MVLEMGFFDNLLGMETGGQLGVAAQNGQFSGLLGGAFNTPMPKLGIPDTYGPSQPQAAPPPMPPQPLGYQSLSDSPMFSQALLKLGTSLLAGSSKGQGFGENVDNALGGFQNTMTEAQRYQTQLQAAQAAAALERAKFLTETGFKTNAANLEQQKFGLDQQKFAANPGNPQEIQAAQLLMKSNPNLSFQDAYLTVKNGMPMAGSSGGTSGNGIAPGDLSGLPPQQASQVKALAEGRMAFPTGMALKSPYWQQMLSNVSQYDPNFDAINYNARSQTRKAFASGKEGQQINSLNTAIGHLGELQDAADQLDNFHESSIPGVTTLNSIKNSLAGSQGKPAITNFNRVVNSVAPELVKVYRGSGGAEADIKSTLGDFSPNATPEQLKGSLQETAKLLQSKIDALNDQYTKGMGISADAGQFINPKSAATLKKLGLSAPELPNQAPNAPANPVQQPNGSNLAPLSPQEAISALRARGHKI